LRLTLVATVFRKVFGVTHANRSPRARAVHEPNGVVRKLRFSGPSNGDGAAGGTPAAPRLNLNSVSGLFSGLIRSLIGSEQRSRVAAVEKVGREGICDELMG
jgi:hypothetical protein